LKPAITEEVSLFAPIAVDMETFDSGTYCPLLAFVAVSEVDSQAFILQYMATLEGNRDVIL